MNNSEAVEKADTRVRDHYVAALRELANQSRRYLAIFAAPLVAIITQISNIRDADTLTLSLISALAVLSLFFGLFLSFYLTTLTDSILAKEVLLLGGDRDGPGHAYLKFIEGKYDDSGIELNEEYFVWESSRMYGPIKWCLFSGYGFSALALIMMIVR